MINGYKNLIKILYYSVLSLILSSCNDLSVFVPPNLSSSLGKMSSVSINEEGKLALEWTKKVGRANGTYEAYLIELDPKDKAYAFTDAMQLTSPLMIEELTVPYESSPYKIGTIVASATELSTILTDTLKPDRKYILQLTEKKKTPKKDPTVLLLQVVFETNLPTSAALTEDGSVRISWTSVPGANRYEIYADKSLTILLGESDLNELILAKGSASFQDFYVRPLRGDLASKDVLHIVMDGSNVKVEKVAAVNANGRYTTGADLEFIVDFSDSVTIFGDTYLPIKTNTGIKRAEYLSGSGSKSLHFAYKVQAGDDSVQIDSGVVLGGTFADKAGISVSGTLPVAGKGTTLKEMSNIAIDTIAPTAPFSVGFDTSLVAVGNFNLSWGAGTDLYFQDHSVKLCANTNCSTSCSSESIVSGITKSFTGIAEGSYYGCVKANDSTGLSSAWVSSFTPVTVDRSGPVVTRVYASSANGIYKEGQTVNIAIEFNEVVEALGTSDLILHLETGNVDRDAHYLSGTGTNTLVFTYSVLTGDATQDLNYLSTTALGLGSVGIIRDLLANPAVLTLPATNNTLSLAGQSAIIIDTGAPGAATAISFGSSLSSSTSLSLTFGHSSDPNLKQHNVKLCESNDCTSSCTTPVVSVMSPASLVGVDGKTYFACVQGEDLVGHLSAWAPSAASIVVDASPPTVTQVSSTSANTVYKETQVIDLTVQFSEPVVVTGGGDIRLKLETGTTDRDAVYSSGSGTDVLSFTYTVQAGDVSSDLNYHSINALTLGSGTIKDAAGHSASIVLPALASAQSLASLRAIRIDTQAPSDPATVTFTNTLSNSTSLSVSWTLSTDANFDHHNLKLCSDAGCSVSCISPISSVGSPAVLTGVDGGSYRACVQGEDSLGHKSAWIASGASASIDMTAPTITDVTSPKVDGLYGSGTSLKTVPLIAPGNSG